MMSDRTWNLIMFRQKFTDMFCKIHKIFLLILFLTGCGRASTPATPDLDQVATIVAATITAMPTSTLIPESGTISPSPTVTPEAEYPTHTPTITLTPTHTDTPPQTITPTLTPTQTGTPPQTITPTLDAEDPRAIFGDPTWKASFKDSSNWYTFEDKQVSIQVKDNTLVMHSYKANNYESWSMANPTISDFYLEIEGTFGEACRGKDRYGLIFRAPNPNQGYLFGISCDGFYRLRAWDGEEFTELVDWSQSEHIQTGPNQVNRIGVMANGDKLLCYVNGKLVEEIRDSTYAKGVFGTYIAASETPGFTVVISQAAYWKIP
jgi:hypothetical protein